MSTELNKILDIETEIDKIAIQEAKNELNRKMKPQGSLGVLEKIVVKMCGIYGYPLKKIDKKVHIVAAADNGIVSEGVSSCPVEYTQIVSEAMLNKIAAIGIFTEKLGIEFNLIDVGMKNSILKEYKNFFNMNVMKGTKNFLLEPAMTREIALKSIKIGIDMIKEKSTKKVTVFSNGEMGIGNTTTSSAVLYSITKGNIDDIVGRGGGLSDEALKRKKEIILKACEKYNTFEMDSIDILAHVGGLDIACMVGMYLGAVKYKKLMLVDGFISAVAALLAFKIDNRVKDFVLFTHMSEEPGMKIVISEFDEKPFLNMEMRLGEGTGAVLVYPMLECAIEMINKMRTPIEVYKLFNV